MKNQPPSRPSAVEFGDQRAGALEQERAGAGGVEDVVRLPVAAGVGGSWPRPRRGSGLSGGVRAVRDRRHVRVSCFRAVRGRSGGVHGRAASGRGTISTASSATWRPRAERTCRSPSAGSISSKTVRLRPPPVSAFQRDQRQRAVEVDVRGLGAAAEGRGRPGAVRARPGARVANTRVRQAVPAPPALPGQVVRRLVRAGLADAAARRARRVQRGGARPGCGSAPGGGC